MLKIKRPFYQKTVNEIFTEINNWLKTEKFQECFRSNNNDFTDFHWIKNGVRICLRIDHKFVTEAYINISRDVLVYPEPFTMKSGKFAHTNKDKILSCHRQFAKMTFGFIPDIELHETQPVEPNKVRRNV